MRILLAFILGVLITLITLIYFKDPDTQCKLFYGKKYHYIERYNQPGICYSLNNEIHILK